MYKLNLSAIKSEVKGKIHNSSLTDVRLERWVNITQDYIWSNVDLKSAEKTSVFDCVADQTTYYIDANIGRIRSLVNTTLESPMTEISVSDIDNTDPARDQTGSSEFYTLYG